MKKCLKIDKFNLSKLIEFIEEKKVAIPEFQRGFVWKTNQVQKLFDSLIRGYPIGVFTLWRTNKNINYKDVLGVKPRTKGDKYFILDGQQRLISLYFLARQNKFDRQIKELFDEVYEGKQKKPINFRNFTFNKKRSNPKLDYSEKNHEGFEISNFYRRLGKYEFPIVTVFTKDYKDAIELFERINQSGTRISTEAIFLSEAWNKQTNLGKIIREWRKKNKKEQNISTKLDNTIFIHSLGIIFQLDNSKDYDPEVDVSLTKLKSLAEEISNENSKKYERLLSKIIESVEKSITLMQNEYNVKVISDLPSKTIVTILSIFYFYLGNNKPSPTQKKEIRKWFWRSALGARYVGASYNRNIRKDPNKMKLLAKKKIKKLQDIDKVTIKDDELLKLDMHTGRSSLKNTIKLMLWMKQPTWLNGDPTRNIYTDSPTAKKEDDHFYAYHLLNQLGVPEYEVNSILNLSFLPKSENDSKKKKIPSSWLKKRKMDYSTSVEDESKYFKSNLLYYKNIRELSAAESKFIRRNGSIKSSLFKKHYFKFLKRRCKLFKDSLNKLQNGRDEI